MKALFSSIYSWADDRLGIDHVLAFAKKKTVPVHSQSVWYYWGGISLFFFLMQGITGLLLLVYYRPGPEAYDSVRQITQELNFGWFIRSLHSWSANLMVISVFVHMFSVYFMKAYRAPREFGWWSGLALLMMVLVFGFSGYLLPMDELAYFATKVGLEIPSSMPGVGRIINDIVRGGPEVNEHTIQRFFSLHVVVLPALFVPLLGFHLWLVQRHGNAVPPSEEAKPAAQRKSVPFFPNFMLHDLAVWLIALNVLSVCAALFPWELGQPADPLKPAPAGIHPEWYFMSSFQVLKALGQWFPGTLGEVLGMVIFNVGLILWFLVPLYDNTTKAGQRGKHATYLGLAALAILALTTWWGYLAL